MKPSTVVGFSMLVVYVLLAIYLCIGAARLFGADSFLAFMVYVIVVPGGYFFLTENQRLREWFNKMDSGFDD